MKKLKQQWTKVKDLKKGMKIAVPTDEALADFGNGKLGTKGQATTSGKTGSGMEKEKDILWDEIVEIKKVGKEKVYDIEVENTHNFVAGHMIGKGKKKSYGGIYAHNTYITGTATSSRLEVGTPTGETGAGDVNISGNYWTNGADYAEYFYTDDIDLQPGELVSVDVSNDGAVKRSSGLSDGNIMGIVSSNPSIIGNTGAKAEWKENSVIIGLLGQVQAKASNENGEIRTGDSLTAASIPGYVMKANAGDATVGVALESLEQDQGEVLVLISRKNKSLTVEQIEDQITDRVAEMEIEDEVNLLIAGAMDNLGVEEKIDEVSVSVLDLSSQANQLDSKVNDLKQQVEDLEFAQEYDEIINVRALNISTSTASTTSDWLGLPQAGDVLVMDPKNDLSAVKNYEKNSNQILGVAVENTENNKVKLALSGSLKIKINLENGIIKKGDLLTTSSVPGYAMKSINENAGIIGIALEDFVENNKISVLLTIRNNISVQDNIDVSVEESAQESQVKIAVEDYDFQGNVAVKDLVINGKVIVKGIAEFLSEANFKSNLNLHGAIVKEYFEAQNEQLAIGDAVYISGSGEVSKAYSDNPEFKPAIGIVVETSEQEYNKIIKVAVGGAVKGFKNLAPGSIYYLNSINNNNLNLNNNALARRSLGEGGTTTATSTVELIEMSSLTNVPAQETGNYIQTIGIAETEESLLIMPSLTYQEYTEDIELPSVNYNPIYIDNVTIKQEQPTSTEEIIEDPEPENGEPETQPETEVIEDPIDSVSEPEEVPEPVVEEPESENNEPEIEPEPEVVVEEIIQELEPIIEE